MATVSHLTGPVLTGVDEVAAEAWVLEGRLTFERPRGAGHDVTTVSGWVIPGLVDAHCHVGWGEYGTIATPAEAERQASADRDGGTLLIRDAGQPGDTRWIDERPDLPVIIRAGKHIARTRRSLPNCAHEVEPEALAQCAAAEARRGDGWVKLVGDWILREQGDLAPSWTPESLRAAADAVHAEGARITAHCFGEEGLADLITAGFDCLEHATGLTDDTIGLAAEWGVTIVPTLVNIANFVDHAAAGERRYPRYATHMRDLHARRYQTVRAAHEAGVAIRAGTDAGPDVAHGRIVDEIVELTHAGLSPAAALDAACWAARRWLGRPGLDEGASADLLVVPTDPRRGLDALAERTVVLRGVAHSVTAP